MVVGLKGLGFSLKKLHFLEFFLNFGCNICNMYDPLRCNLNIYHVPLHFRDLVECMDPIIALVRITATQAEPLVQSLDSLQLQFWPT